MKKILVISLILIATGTSKAQSDSTKFFQKIKCGLIVSTVASTDFTNSEKPFTTGANFMANILFVTPKTYHNVFYNISNNSIVSLNGYPFSNNWDTYIVYADALTSKDQYLGVGIEKMLKMGDVNSFLFTEIGTDFHNNPSLSVGILLSYQNTLWKRH